MAKLRLVEPHAFADLLESELLMRPAEALEQVVKRLGGTPPVQLHAVEPLGEVEQMAVDLPSVAAHSTGVDPTAVRLKDHPRQCFERCGCLFPSAGKRFGKDIGMKLQIGHWGVQIARIRS